MRAYLSDFFRDFAWPEEDAQFLLACYDRIQADPEARKRWEEALGMYDRNPDCDYGQILKLAEQAAEQIDRHELSLHLLVYVCMSRRLKQYYAQKGIDPEIYRTGVLDLRNKLLECKAVYGFAGTMSGTFFPTMFRMTRFCLGRLQFEVLPFGAHYERNGHVLTPESKILNIHIPQTGTPLDPESCEAAFRQAKAFFAGQVDEPCAFHCRSWLLFPEHRRMLPAHSNIRRFMERFDLYDRGVYLKREALRWLFDTEEKNPDRLPTDNSLRRCYVEFLKQGGRPGWGAGVFFME